MTDAQQTASRSKPPRLFRLIGLSAAADARQIFREGLLAFLISMPLIIAALYRFLLPALEAQLQTRLDFDLAPYHPMLMGAFVGMSPALIGAVYGLLLVDERDQRTLPVLRIMPVSFGVYLAARLTVPFVLAVLVTTGAYPFAGLTPLPLGTVFLLSLSAATVLPVATLIIVFAQNKLTGLVLFRLVSTVTAAPVFAYIVPVHWEPVAWIISSFWPIKALWLAAEGAPFALELAIAPIMNLVLGWLLYRRFAGRSE